MAYKPIWLRNMTKLFNIKSFISSYLAIKFRYFYSKSLSYPLLTFLVISVQFFSMFWIDIKADKHIQIRISCYSVPEIRSI